MRVALLCVALACTLAVVSGIPISMMESRATASKPGAGEECGLVSQTRAMDGACMTAALCKKFSHAPTDALTNICAGNLVCCIGSAATPKAAAGSAASKDYYNVREKNVDPAAPKVNSGRFAKRGAATNGAAAPTAPASGTPSSAPASAGTPASTNTNSGAASSGVVATPAVPSTAPVLKPASSAPSAVAPAVATPTGQACDYSNVGWCPSGQTCFTYPGGQVGGGSGHYCGPSYATTPVGPWGVKLVGSNVCHGCNGGFVCCSYPPTHGQPAHYCGSCRSFN